MVSKEKELELINTIREMLKNGDSEEDIITIFEGFGLDKEYVSELIDKAKGKKTIHDFISVQQVEEAQKLQTSLNDTQNKQDKQNNNVEKKNEDMEEIRNQIQKLNEKIDKLSEDLEKIKEDVEATRLILEKLMKIYRSVLNKILSKYS